MALTKRAPVSRPRFSLHFNAARGVQEAEADIGTELAVSLDHMTCESAFAFRAQKRKVASTPML